MISLSAMGGKLCSFLGCGLPSRTKRLILVTSLTARVKNDPDLDRATLKRLNELLDLCSSENAMRLPAHLSSVIWNGERNRLQTRRSRSWYSTLSNRSHCGFAMTMLKLKAIFASCFVITTAYLTKAYGRRLAPPPFLCTLSSLDNQSQGCQ